MLACRSNDVTPASSRTGNSGSQRQARNASIRSFLEPSQEEPASPAAEPCSHPDDDDDDDNDDKEETHDAMLGDVTAQHKHWACQVTTCPKVMINLGNERNLRSHYRQKHPHSTLPGATLRAKPDLKPAATMAELDQLQHPASRGLPSQSLPEPETGYGDLPMVLTDADSTLAETETETHTDQPAGRMVAIGSVQQRSRLAPATAALVDVLSSLRIYLTGYCASHSAKRRANDDSTRRLIRTREGLSGTAVSHNGWLSKSNEAAEAELSREIAKADFLRMEVCVLSAANAVARTLIMHTQSFRSWASSTKASSLLALTTTFLSSIRLEPARTLL